MTIMCNEHWNYSGWSQYEWTDPPGTQYPSRTNNEYNEVVFVQKGNIIFTGISFKLSTFAKKS